MPSDSSTTCPDVSGTFENYGQFSHNRFDNRPFVLLSRFFLQHKPEPSHEAMLRLRQSEDEALTFEVLDTSNGTVVSSGEISRQQVICEDGALWLPTEIIESYEGPAGYRARWRLGLRKATDGSLVGENRLFTMGYFFLVPIVGTQTLWYNWKSRL